MTSKGNGGSVKQGNPQNKHNGSPVKGGYTPSPTSERAPAPPPKNP